MKRFPSNVLALVVAPLARRRKGRTKRKLAGLAVCWATLALPVLFLANAGPANAQSPTEGTDYVPTLTFDVASIRESAPSDSFTVSGMNPPHSSLLKLANNTVLDMIVMAYRVDYHRVLGVPDWVSDTRYMLEAKSDSTVDERLAQMNHEQARLEKQHMLQMLLADRFQLKVRRETRVGTVYNLVVAKGGPKMSTDLKPPAADEVARFNGVPVPPIYQFGDGRLGYKFIAHGATMDMLAMGLDGQFDTNVSDKTGLTGKYDFVLQYSRTLPGTSSRDPNAWPPLVTALPEQLGLKLEPYKGPMDVLVIEHIEKPSPN
jgi:uncharacterized protein (TIGR03435 family)